MIYYSIYMCVVLPNINISLSICVVLSNIQYMCYITNNELPDIPKPAITHPTITLQTSSTTAQSWPWGSRKWASSAASRPPFSTY